MSDTREQDGRHLAGSRSRRRPRQESRRPRTVRFDLTEAEFAELQQAADRAGLAKGAYAAEAALAAATGTVTAPDMPFREALAELIVAAGLVRRIGVNDRQRCPYPPRPGRRGAWSRPVCRGGLPSGR
jgi:hypothetical protein